MGWAVSATTRPLYPQEWPGSHYMEGWVDRCERVRKILPPPEVNPRTVQPVASRYTDYAIPAPNL